MNFDFSWFTTVPGILITGGVLLLIIALIILIATTGKKNKEEVYEEDMGATEDPNMMNQAAMDPNMAMPMPEAATPAPEAVTEMPGGENAAPNNDSIMNIPEPVQTPEIATSDMSNVAVEEVPAMPEAAPAQPEINVQPVQEAPVMEQPVQQPAQPETIQPEPVQTPVTPAPEVTPAQPEIITPVQEAPVMEQPPVEQANNGAYGGASPTVGDVNVSNPAPAGGQIYGGANPLENTQSIPISNIVGPNASQAPEAAPQPAEPTMITPQPEPVQPTQQ